ncbi:hypothetical protein [Croceicoccus bisphenolivorans]|uniref:hypothetical protein n=1 Tax=Croceicoccus bisphenolivorans TaxID=1783232 RepID=UPI00083297BA|nr:hypothetical protein [Croceicoccus bisphenolivorans]
MNRLIEILASLLRIGGALAGVAVVFLISDQTLAGAITSAGLEGRVSPAMARMGAHAVFGVLGFIVGSQLAAILTRGPATPAGTRKDAAEAVPRLRRHLVEGGQEAKASPIPRYLDPDPAPTQPVAVSFKELGLDHPSAHEYPAPGGESVEVSDDFAFREEFDRPDSAGSASDEWDDFAAPRPVEAAPPAAAAPVPDSRQEEVPAAVQPAAEALAPESGTERQSSMPQPVSNEGPAPFGAWPAASDPAPASAVWPETAADGGEDIFAPWPDDMVAAPAAEEQPAPADVPPVADIAPVHPASTPAMQAAEEPVQWSPSAAPATGAVGSDGYSRPSFARPGADGDAGWYDGAGDEEEDAEDDGAGYGSLADIGLGKNHAPRAESGQRGEAGLPPAPYAPSKGGNPVPHGKPQDFRLREALAELQRLDPYRP